MLWVSLFFPYNYDILDKVGFSWYTVYGILLDKGLKVKYAK